MNEQIDKSISTVLDLPDDRFMLALCVRPENLQDPAKWCAEMRASARARKVGPTSVQEAENMMETSIRLAEEAAGVRPQQISS